MILKEPGDHKIHCLRVIHLYKHDYNLLLAIKWRLLIQRSTQQQRIHPGQFGGIPGRDAILPTVIKELQYEISCASKRPLVHVDFDTTACYDRIVIPFSSLVARGFGQHCSVVHVHATTLQEAKYLLKAQLGISESFYKHCALFPIQGSGQGPGNSPGIWCCISLVLFLVFDQSAHGAQYSSPDGQFMVQVYLIGFVDDTSCSVNNFYSPVPKPVSHYISKATHDAQLWNNVLSLSGGALNPEKCSYHALYYQFSVNGLPVPCGSAFDLALKIQFSPAASSRPLIQLPVSTTHKTLGVHKSPLGSTTKAFTLLLAKAMSHANLVARNPLDRRDVWAYYHAVALPSLTYPFPSMTMTNAQCMSLQKVLKRAILPKYGFNRCTPNAVVFESSDFGGLEFRTMSTELGLAQLQSFLICLRSTGVQHKLAVIAVSWAQHLAETSVPIFEDVTTPLPQLDPMLWLPSIRTFLSTLRCSLEIALPSLIPPPQCLHDCHIMDFVLHAPFTPHQVRLINCCRLFLGVPLLSDIVTHDGCSLCQSVLDGKPPPYHTFKGLQPYQALPGPRAWHYWRRALALFTCPGSSVLKQPLGFWVQSGQDLYHEWISYITPYPQRVSIKKNSLYKVYNPVGSNLHYSGSTVPVLPSSSVPVELDYSTRNIRVVAFTPAPVCTLLPGPPSSFLDFVGTLPEWEQRLSCSHLILFRRSIFLCVMSPGLSLLLSFFGLDRSVGWLRSQLSRNFWVGLRSLDGTRLASNFGIAYGYRTTSFCAELYGLLSFLRFLIPTHEYTVEVTKVVVAIVHNHNSRVKSLH